MVNHRSIIIHKTGHKKGRRGMTMILIKIIILLLQNKLLIYLIQDTLLAQKRISQDKTSSIPKRKKRKSIGLSQEEINFNYEHSKKRIVIEHVISRLKKYRILSDVFRNRLEKYNKVSDIVSGLVNYRILNYHNQNQHNPQLWCKQFLIM